MLRLDSLCKSGQSLLWGKSVSGEWANPKRPQIVGGLEIYEHVERRNGNDDLLRYADTSMISRAYVWDKE